MKLKLISTRLTSHVTFLIIFSIYALKTIGITDSYSVGVLILISVFLVIYKSSQFNFEKWIFWTIAVAIFLLSQLVLGIYVSGININFPRFISHFIVFMILILMLNVSSCKLVDITNIINSALSNFFYIFPFILIISWLNLIPVHSFGVNYSKPMFPFQEPSHYFNFLTLCSMVYAKNRNNIVPLLFYPISLYVFPSASGMFGLLLLIFFILLKSKANMSYSIFFIPIFLIFIFFSFNFLDVYYLERIFFWNSNNLSALVFLQGFESAYLGFVKSLGIGVGLGQMPDIVVQTETAKSIVEITEGIYFNIYSGSFVFSQLVTEFGLLGIIMIFSIVWLLFKSRLYLKSNEVHLWMPPVLILASMVEIWIRGYGLFSPIMFLCYVGIFFHLKNIRDLNER